MHASHNKTPALAQEWYRCTVAIVCNWTFKHVAAPQLYGTAEDCAILYAMNELYRQQSEREIGGLPVLLWAIGVVFTMILIHGLVGYA